MPDGNDGDRNNNEYERGPLTAREINNVRRMLADYVYQRRIKRMIKVWVFAVGASASVMAAMLSVWKEIASRIWK